MTNELDLQEETRMWDVYDKLQTMIVMLEDLPVFPSLVWLWTWDIASNEFKSYQSGDDYYKSNPNLTLDQVFRMFWEDSDKNGFSLEYGTEDLNDAIRDWMIDRNILIPVEDLEEEENAVE